MNDRRNGNVTLIDNERGYGVIIDANGQDIQFLLAETLVNITVNSKVTFEIVLTRNGLMAANVILDQELVNLRS
ncbi:hypothetical protein ASE74_16905 [Pedobacter sp. Leaf216]|uniref:cold shock domain-containing protein n=1 Tax=Pedobacter sp. Leaf216 TaxID=1735684 RepID=UPI0006F4DA2C|nr:cold shock domain-containing protein [Pedobacter sp. Leaf216]KQM76953.1 hypothetical protein ASE74_16905 [Pedobacter sp. Leaf216]